MIRNKFVPLFSNMGTIEIYHITSAASSAVIATLATLLFVVKLPSDEKWLKLRRARGYLAVAFCILAVIGTLNYGVADDGFSRKGMFSATLFISSAQALLIAATVFVFICPLKINRRWIFTQMALIVAGGVMLVSAWASGNATAFAACCVIAMVLYIFQLSAYFFMFFNRYRPFVKQVETYYDDVEEPRLKWILMTFCSGGAVGILALPVCVATLSSLEHKPLLVVYIVFTILYLPFFVYLTSRFISYCVHSSFIVTAVTAELPANSYDDNELPMREQRDADFKELLDKWVAEKRYLQKDLAVDDIASQLGTTRSYIAFYFRTYMHTNFRAWRTELRIAEAKHLLAEHPDWTLDRIADSAGFNHRANFFQQFQKVTGMKPSDFTKR